MRIAVILTYPLYHASAVLTVEQWLKQPDREREIASSMARMGHQVEVWVVGETAQATGISKSDADEINAADYKIRFFKPNKKRKKTKTHFSEALVAHASQFAADLYILKGVDGGVGNFLLRNYPEAANQSLAFIIGGEYYSTYIPKAEIVFYETQWQKQMLLFPRWRFWRKKIPDENLILMPKFIDTRIFHPMEKEPKTWDILVVGRLIPRYKNYDALGLLSQQFRVALAGDGPDTERLSARYPNVDWLGHIPNHQLPQYYNRSHLFMHTGFRDFYPRVIAEAMACGLPCIAFARTIAPGILPSNCGMLLEHRSFIPPILDLLKDKKRLLEMGRQARQHALTHTGKDACLKAIKEMFLRLKERSQP